MKREPAVKLRIKDIVEGKFVPGEKESMKTQLFNNDIWKKSF